MRNLVLTCVLLCCGIVPARAFHIIGGEMYYQCMPDGTYDFTMKLFRDCGNNQGAPFDNPASFGIFDENNQLVDQITVNVTSITPVIPDLSSPCISIPPNICVEEGTYEFTLDLPDDGQTYTVVYQRCCRNQTIQNLEIPGSQGLTIAAEVPAMPDGECNSRPSYNNFPPPILCAQEYLEFDHSATDLDGDSLAYSLCSPFIGASQDAPQPSPPSAPPYPTVNWAGGFDELNPITGNPGLSIDPITGLLSGTPTVIGQFVVGVCVEEWRDGQLLSVNTRDFQFNVAVCEESTEAIIEDVDPAEFCEDLTVEFYNASDPSNDFLWDFGDPENDEDTSENYDGIYTYPDTGTYTVTLITNPGFFCSDTSIIEIPLYMEISVEVSVADFECINGQQVFSFEADGDFDHENSTVLWDFGDGASPSNAQGLIIDGIEFVETGPQQVFVEVLNNICPAADSVDIVIPEAPTAEITPQNIFCSGLSYQFSQTSENANIYLWDFGVEEGDGDTSADQTPTFLFPEPGEYEVSLTVQSVANCPVTVTENFEIYPLLEADFDPPPIACFEGNSLDFSAGGSYTDDAIFSWAFESGSPATSSSENPSGIEFSEAGASEVTLTISENGCTRSTAENVVLHNNPVADFELFPPGGCLPVDVLFSNRSTTSSSNVEYTWDFGDGMSATGYNVEHTYNRPGLYTVSLTVQNLNGCIDSDTYTVEDVVEVVPSPTASFRVNPGIISVFDPVVEITDLSLGSISCEYLLDGQVFSECDFTHEMESLEAQTITLTATNEYGCSDQAEAEIKFSDHIIYIPNSFTPDADGLNDLFIPEVIGATNIQMFITDRWGREVFSNEHVTRGWDGGDASGEYYAEAGVYQYFIIITDNLGWNFEYLGTVTLLR